MSERTKASVALDRMLRPVRPLTQKQLAEELGVTQQAVSLWLSGRSKPDANRRERIAKITGVPVTDWDEAEESGAQLTGSDG